jgi:hypothetical protein
LLYPRQEVPLTDDGGASEVALDLFLHILKAGRYSDALGDREGKPLCLSGSVVGVLSEDHDPNLR